MKRLSTFVRIMGTALLVVECCSAAAAQVENTDLGGDKGPDTASSSSDIIEVQQYRTESVVAN